MHERMKKLIFPFFILSMLVLNSYSFAQVEIETANVLSTWTQSDKSTINSWNFYQNQLGSIAFDVLADGDFYCSNYFYACAVDASLNRLVYGQSSNNVVDILNKNFILHQYGLGSGDITFNSPRGAALNNSTIYVSDTGNNRVVKLNHDTAGNITSTEILNGFNQPMRMAMAPDGSAWVADKGNNRVVNTSSGAATGGWQFDSPEAVAVIDYDEILVVDTGNDRVVYLNLSTSEWHTVDFPSDAHLVDVVINDGTEAYVADDGRNLVHKIKLPDEYIASQPQGSPSCLTYGIGIIGVNNSFGNWTLASYNPVKDIKICDVETPSSTPIQYSYLLTMSGSVTEQIKDISTGNVLKNINVNVSTELGASITGVWDLTDDSGNPVAPGQYILRVSSPGCSDEKTIEVLSTAPDITITSPNGGESWVVGEMHAITWTSSNFSGNVKIELSTNGGSSWSDIVSSTDDDGSYGWTVPNAVSSNCRIRISDAADGDPSDESGVFTIESPPVGLHAHWRFDETSGSTAYDASGNGHHATLENGAAFTTGLINNAVELDGSNDNISAGTFDVPPGNGLTIAGWIRPDDFGAVDARILSKAVGVYTDDHYWMLSTHTTSHVLRFRLKTDGSTSTLIAGSGGLTAGEWAHVAATWDGSTMRLYKNAVEVGSMSKTGTLSTNSSAPVTIGNQGGSNPFDGLIDDMRLYNTGLSQSEISDLYQQGANPPPESITVISPNGGENWTVGSNHTINWDSENFSGTVQIEFSDNGGSSWSDIVSSTTDDGSYGWTVPDNVSSNCKIRISDAADGDPSDESGTFSIIEEVVPTGGARVEIDPYNQYDAFVIRVYNNSSDLSITSVDIWNDDAGTFDYVYNGSNCTLSPDMGGNNDFAVQEITLTFSGSGLAPGSSGASGDGDLDCTTKAFVVTVHFSDGSTLSGSMTNQGDSDDANSELWVYDSGGSAPPPPEPSIVVTSPNSGESWAVGSSRTITWDSPNF
ncbi:hypothetical protein JW960_00665, partial [candidate division KSB1 bacterium]|nr:hypothetical protein [candidate division KSB1 bacterium]